MTKEILQEILHYPIPGNVQETFKFPEAGNVPRNFRTHGNHLTFSTPSMIQEIRIFSLCEVLKSFCGMAI